VDEVAAALRLGGCFASGTPVRTPRGARRIEDLRVGDLVLSQPDSARDWPVEPKVIEKVYAREGRIFHLHVGGEVIRVTPEHPLYVLDKGWIPAGDLQPNAFVATLGGSTVRVEEIYDTGAVETVYNFTIADYHTYFIGEDEWGFAIWVHNANCTILRRTDGIFELIDTSNQRVLMHRPEQEVRDFASENGHRITGFAEGSGRVLPSGDGTVVRSRISESRRLEREAERATRS